MKPLTIHQPLLHATQINFSRPGNGSLFSFFIISAFTMTIGVMTNMTSPGMYSLPIEVTIVTLEYNDSTYPWYSRIMPVMNMAVMHVQRLYKGRIIFNFIHGVGSCNRSRVGVMAAQIKCSSSISVFIGPSCSKAAETIGYMAADWNVPILTIGNTGNIGNKLLFPTLIRVNAILLSSVVHAVISLIEEYKWYTLAMFSDDSRSGDLVSWTFRSLSQKPGYRLYEYHMKIKESTTLTLEKYLKDAATKARVFLLAIGHSKLSLQFWFTATRLEYSTSGEFAWLKVDTTSIPSRKLWNWHPLYSDEIREAYAHVLYFVVKTAEIRPEKVSKEKDDPISDKSRRSSAHRVHIWDSVMMYAQVVNETLAEGSDPYDGRALRQKMSNRSFEGLRHTIIMDEHADRVTDVQMYAMIPETGDYKVYATKYSFDDRIQYHSADSFPWPYNGGKPPLNEPVCGYTGRKCSHNSDTVSMQPDNSALVKISIGVGTLVVIASIVAVFLYRKCTKQSEEDIWWWLIAPGELKTPYSTQSFSSKMNITSSGIEIDSADTREDTLAIYKGQIVRTKKIDIRQLKVSQEILNDFKTMREIGHNNLARLCGAHVNGSVMSLVTEYCPKGTLRDLLETQHISLDTHFKFSLCKDIVDGLCYLHTSSVKCHGRLTSKVCCLDSRFTIKLADFGMSALYTIVASDISTQEYKIDSLWRAPELLRARNLEGGKEGDVYSFGIILSEIISRESPFSDETTYMTIEEILEKIKTPSPHAFRPAIQVPTKLADMQTLMEKCWCENPKLRPPAQAIKGDIRIIARDMGESGNLLDSLLRRMEKYANNLEMLAEEKTVELRCEKKKSEELLYQILPRYVADCLKAGLPVEPEEFNSVTIYFSDIVGFTAISAASTAIQIVDLLNDLYSHFDAIVEEFDVYKVETIGDAYMVVSGLPQRNGSLHAVHIARMSLKLLAGIPSFRIRHMSDEKIKLRIGLHSGRVCAGVVGQKMPRFCLFGDTVNTASRMESHSEALRIHISEDCQSILARYDTFVMIPRGQIFIKGKGIMSTYWLTGETQA